VFVTYDGRLRKAALSQGLDVESPSCRPRFSRTDAPESLLLWDGGLRPGRSG
jgi:hypothetical protein